MFYKLKDSSFILLLNSKMLNNIIKLYFTQDIETTKVSINYSCLLSEIDYLTILTFF